MITSLLYWVFYYSGIYKILLSRGNVSGIIMYHGVNTSSLSISTFKKQIFYLCKYYNIVTLSDITSIKTKNNKYGNIALTFDDGLKSFFMYVYPFLKEYNIPATVFVCPGLVDKQEWIWVQSIRGRLRYLSQEDRDAVASMVQAPNSEVETIVERMKHVSIDNRLLIETKIKNITANYTPSDAEIEANDIMEWSDIKSMDRNIINVGSHTVNHPNLLSLDEKEMEHEIRDSKYLLENKLNIKVESFCYPNGMHNESVESIVAKYYKCAVSTSKGYVQIGDNPYSLRRISAQSTLPCFVWRMFRTK